MSPATVPRVVFFDFDGVLADTESVHVAAWERTFGALGWDIPAETCARAAEQDDRAFLRDVFHTRGCPEGDLDGWVARKQQLTRMLLADAPRLYPGVRALVETLRDRDIRLGVVSSTWRENIAIVLGTEALIHAFAWVVCKEDVAALKPAPDAYHLALARAKIPPAAALALEDSPSGLHSARAAGIRPVAIGHRRAAGPWTGESVYLKDLRDPHAMLRLLEP